MKAELALNCAWRIALAIALLITFPSFARAQTTNFTAIYNSGLLTLGPDETLRLTIVNDNNISDPALRNLPASAESCTVVAQFLDGNGSALQREQQTLQPGQNVSFSINGQQTVQARVDVSPGTNNGFAVRIAGQCVVSNEILNTASNDAVLIPPLSSSLVTGDRAKCRRACEPFCRPLCVSDLDCVSLCTAECKAGCDDR